MMWLNGFASACRLLQGQCQTYLLQIFFKKKTNQESKLSSSSLVGRRLHMG
jgi:hypothetical protein